jgi:thiol-disulfide isomerase/thioredoxin
MGDERRKYYRYPPTGGSESVVLRRAGVESTAKLVNFSADGFRLDLDVDSIVEVGDVVLLATSNGFHRVRIVNVARESGVLQLGLHRLEDLPASAIGGQAAGENGRTKKKPGRRSTFSSPLIQFAIPIVLGAMILAAIAVTWTSDVDPAGVLVGERGWTTPTSEYGGRRRRQQPEAPEQPTPIVREKHKTSQAMNDRDSAAASQSEKRPRKSAAASESRPSETVAADESAKKTGPQTARQTVGQSGQSSVRRSAPESASAGSDSVRQGPRFTPFADATTSPSAPSAVAAEPLFDAQADATVSIDAALQTANRENKRVLVEFGANTCGPCNELHRAFTNDAEIAATFQKAFVLVLVDLDANQKLVSRYVNDGPRQRVPFLALLDKQGNVLKRRRTAELEAGSKLDIGKVKEFLQQWSSST